MTESSKGERTVFRAVEVSETCHCCSPSTLDDGDTVMDDDDDGGDDSDDDDDDAPGLKYGLEALPGPELEPSLPAAADAFCFPFLLALWTRRSVALVTLRKTKSKSSLYPGHCLLALRH